jgi:hypothetical protein
MVVFQRPPLPGVARFLLQAAAAKSEDRDAIATNQ